MYIMRERESLVLGYYEFRGQKKIMYEKYVIWKIGFKKICEIRGIPIAHFQT